MVGFNLPSTKTVPLAIKLANSKYDQSQDWDLALVVRTFTPELQDHLPGGLGFCLSGESS